MSTLIRQRSRGFWAVLAVGIVAGMVLNGMFRPQFALADADTNNGDKFAQLTTQVEQLSAAQNDTQQALVEALDAVEALQTDLDTVEGKLQNVHVVGNDVIFEGVNVVVQNGSGLTYGPINGTGNLIIGYDEIPQNSTFDRKTGSHNLVVGGYHTYTGLGGFVAGYGNTVGTSCSVSGGQLNIADGSTCSVSGGEFNKAMGSSTSVSGGEHNEASFSHSSVSGGVGNNASGTGSSISGGGNNSATHLGSNISGGWDQHTTSNYEHLP